MPDTSKGFPYPLPTDRVNQGAANIQALAQAVDDYIGRHFRHYTEQVEFNNSDVAEKSLTWGPPPFDYNPRVQVTAYSNLFNAAVIAASITTTGCTLSVRRIDGALYTGSVTVSVLAVRID